MTIKDLCVEEHLLSLIWRQYKVQKPKVLVNALGGSGLGYIGVLLKSGIISI